MSTSTHSWPNGARVAVLISVLFEAWSDGKFPTYFTRTTPLKPGTTDQSAIRWSQYGGNEGIWRIMQIVGNAALPATVFANALAAERYPDAIRRIVQAGHAVAGHGYAQDQYLLDFDRDGQRALITKSLDILERAAGRRPDGWTTPVYGGNEHTIPLLVGAGMQWHCDALDFSMPRIEQTGSGPIVAIPWCEFVDNRVLRSNPRDYLDVYQGMFDYLYASEPMSLLHIAIHAHTGGRPLIAAMFNEVLRYIKGFPEVWFARHNEIARWKRDNATIDISPKARFPGSS
ncbi:MAG: hypothetical protein EXR39_12170 [Betaproteobacteria bacterium]|nr:hypothetical protein [Betaproteobacteria bacterium]